MIWSLRVDANHSLDAATSTTTPMKALTCLARPRDYRRFCVRASVLRTATLGGCGSSARAVISTRWSAVDYASGIGPRRSNRYPTPRTVVIQRGWSGSTSIFRRTLRMCSVTVASSCHSLDDDHTF